MLVTCDGCGTARKEVSSRCHNEVRAVLGDLTSSVHKDILQEAVVLQEVEKVSCGSDGWLQATLSFAIVRATNLNGEMHSTWLMNRTSL